MKTINKIVLPIALIGTLIASRNNDKITNTKEKVLDNQIELFYIEYSSGKEKINLIDRGSARFTGIFENDTLIELGGIGTKDYKGILLEYANPDSMYSIREYLRK